ncbi:lectin-like domain-containing protein, partial [Leuconostoc pseudomesenteroides]|uniref:lectin-like domain-containing protein n=1 Tax=Leuconostoc pseudomesenteroides TaxID=33968 RepID=UPI004035F3F1
MVYADSQEQTDYITINQNNFNNNFTILNSNITNYNASTGILKLTNNVNQTGVATFNKDIDLSKPFSISAMLNVGNGNVADGIGFSFYSGDRNQIGANAGNLGVYGIPNAFGWKIDTWHNENQLMGQNDSGLANTYAAFVTTNSSGIGKIDQSSTSYQPLPSGIKDGQFHDVNISYDGNMNISITLSYGGKNYIFSKNLQGVVTKDLPLHFNFSASTGGLPTVHQIKFKSMSYYESSEAPIINNVYDSSNLVSGHGVPGSVVTLTNSSGKVLGFSTVKNDGSWEISIANKGINSGDILEAVQKSTGKGTSVASKVTVLHDTKLDDQKANQKKNLQDEHDKIVNDIKNDNTLTAAEKQKQTADADKALTTAQNNIDQATNADDVNKAFDNGKAAIDATHVPGTKLDEEMCKQKKTQQDEEEKIVIDSMNDNTMTAAEKQKQTADADRAVG